jgi:hypothetical protein
VRRAADGGHALLLALVVLLVTSLAGGLVAGALSLEQRQLLRRIESAKVRALLDAALSTAVARITADPHYRGHEEAFGDGRIAIEAESTGKATVSLVVLVDYRARGAAGRATVALLTEDGPKVVRWEALPPRQAPAGLRRRLEGPP